MTFDEIQQVVVDRLFEIAARDKFDAYEVDVPVGSARPNVEHNTNPYVLIDFGGKGQTTYENQGITGTRDNMKWTSVVFEVVTNNPSTNRKISRIIRDEFEGYSPDPTWGEFIERVAAPMHDRQPSSGGEFYPPRYSRAIGYVVDVDA